MMRIWMTDLLFFVVQLVFSVVKTKIIHHSSMTYLPLTYLAAALAPLNVWISRRLLTLDLAQDRGALW
ncbi:MAG: hypothetical protein IPP80_14415 [Ignavibacteria bacterium]|nr:hypothetical protein [Ignavibacteria bacterium]